MSRFVVGLIGSGIGGSLTPLMHEAEARRLGLDYEYRLIDLDALDAGADDLHAILQRAEADGLAAVNVTHPVKQAVIPLLTDLTADASQIGAVNLVRFEGGRRVGDNTDWLGFRLGMERQLAGAATTAVAQFGAGGAGAAVAYALLGLGAERLALVEPDRSRAELLAARLGSAFPRARVELVEPSETRAVLAKVDGAVNATPLGMHGHPGMSFDPRQLRADAWVADAVYFPLETELIGAARAAGLPVADGGWMAVGQAVASLKKITGAEPSLDRVREDFIRFQRAGLTAAARDAARVGGGGH
ncbi:shikimate dehydrogenase [Gryllotalpicola koreensis]|uniref:Shikimate dehydrogenase n=1 Tax=Gryllotalpicola koreensis TaxID=993086 RepID=A0ABP8A2M2_9MICO